MRGMSGCREAVKWGQVAHFASRGRLSEDESRTALKGRNWNHISNCDTLCERNWIQ